MNSKNALLFIHAQTSLHPGTGTALGTVDMPIQRERHTNWPMIAGSSLKGVIREHCRHETDEDSDDYRKWCDVFGAESKNSDNPQAGALSFTDARILAFPVRSARGVFVWVTCKDVLDRLARDAKLAGCVIPWKANGEGDANAAIVCSSELVIEDGDAKKLLLEEYDFDVEPSAVLQKAAQEVAAWIAGCVTSDVFTQERLKTHLVILPDTEFTHFVKNATEVTARIGLDYQTKTVRKGALFYEEFLPPETLMYSLVIANQSRAREFDLTDSKPMDAGNVFDYVAERLRTNSTLQIGANETIGKGICSISLANN